MPRNRLLIVFCNITSLETLINQENTNVYRRDNQADGFTFVFVPADNSYVILLWTTLDGLTVKSVIKTSQVEKQRLRYGFP